MIFRHRSQFGAWLNSIGLVGSGAEIGCARGDFASNVLQQWQGIMYYMIDPWAPQDPSVYRERQPELSEYERWYRRCELLSKADSRVMLLRADSLSGAKMIGDASLDFAYIDGNHSFDAVTADLNAWWPKVKKGGILAGHDFMTKTDEGWYCEVDRAVEQWAGKLKLAVGLTTCPGFWIRKDE